MMSGGVTPKAIARGARAAAGGQAVMARLFSGPDDKRIKRALCIVAHPDDIEFYCAGVVLMMARHGVVVDFVLATSGDKGARDATKSRAKMAQIREREQELAADVLGVKRVAFLRHPDAELVESLELRKEFVRRDPHHQARRAC